MQFDETLFAGRFDSQWARLLIDTRMSYSAAITVRLSLFVLGASYVGDSNSP